MREKEREGGKEKAVSNKVSDRQIKKPKGWRNESGQVSSNDADDGDGVAAMATTTMTPTTAATATISATATATATSSDWTGKTKIRCTDLFYVYKYMHAYIGVYVLFCRIYEWECDGEYVCMCIIIKHLHSTFIFAFTK